MTNIRVLLGICLPLTALLLASSGVLGQRADEQSTLPEPSRHVNLLPTTGDRDWKTIFWFGRATDHDNYVDVRLSYDDTELYVFCSIIDYYFWYDESHTSDPEEWDAVVLLLDTEGDGSSTPQSDDYYLVSGLRYWEENLLYQKAYQGQSGGWMATDVDFDTRIGFRGVGFNDNTKGESGWASTFMIPFASLGLGGPPPRGTVWRVAVVLHDRDDAPPTPMIAQRTWPGDVDSQVPATWGELAFDPSAYEAPSAITEGITMVREGWNGSTEDAYVGGGGDCSGGRYGGGDVAHPDDELFVQNQSDLADFPCFSKSYLKFELAGIPSSKVIISAALTLHQFGSSDPSQAQPSWIQVFMVSDDWSEDTLTWNNAPMAQENVMGSGIWVSPTVFPGWPGIPWTWDVTQAVAEAHAADDVVNIALYSTDSDYHSGKYFVHSETGDWNQAARPTLSIAWGEPVAVIDKNASRSLADFGDVVTYTLTFLGSGEALTVTDPLPVGISAPISPTATCGEVSYGPQTHAVVWHASPEVGQPVTITLPVAVTVSGPLAIKNTATLTGTSGTVAADSVTIIVGGFPIYLPVVMRDL